MMTMSVKELGSPYNIAVSTRSYGVRAVSLDSRVRAGKGMMCILCGVAPPTWYHCVAGAHVHLWVDGDAIFQSVDLHWLIVSLLL